jgi:hypothetical protein
MCLVRSDGVARRGRQDRPGAPAPCQCLDHARHLRVHLARPVRLHPRRCRGCSRCPDGTTAEQCCGNLITPQVRSHLAATRRSRARTFTGVAVVAGQSLNMPLDLLKHTVEYRWRSSGLTGTRRTSCGLFAGPESVRDGPWPAWTPVPAYVRCPMLHPLSTAQAGRARLSTASPAWAIDLPRGRDGSRIEHYPLSRSRRPDMSRIRGDYGLATCFHAVPFHRSVSVLRAGHVVEAQ